MTSPARRKLIVLIAALAAMALTARLGWWQLDRAAQKQALQQALDARSKLPELQTHELAKTIDDASAQHYRRIRLQGEWMPQATVFLDNRQMNGRQGFFVVTPLKLGDADAVLVQRGWAPRDMRDRSLLPTVPTPSGRVEFNAQIAAAPARLFEFAHEASGALRQNLDPSAYASELRIPLRPLSVQLIETPGAAADGLLRQWPAPAVDIHKHYGYAFQWFALCALIAGLYVWFQIIRA